MTYKGIEVISRVSGATVPAKLVICDCGCFSFQIYIVEDHPHLQCLRCGTTHCQGNRCSGADEIESLAN